MGRYINPFTDVGFKIIFGQEINKSLLIHFLNNVIDEFTIEDVTFLDKQQLPEYDEQRSLIYDVFCQTSSGQHIIVEMQNRSQPHFKDRSLYYASKSIDRQGVRGAWNYEISAFYLIAFLNFTLPDVRDAFRVDVGLVDLATHKIFSDKLRLIYLQLPLFNEKESDCDTDFKCWIYVLKNMETLNRLPFSARNAVFERLSQIAEVRSLTHEEQVQYENSLRNYRDTYAVMEGRYQDGIEKGIEKGKRQMAASMIREGIALERIAAMSGISLGELQEMADSIGQKHDNN